MRSARFVFALALCFLPVFFISCSIEEASTEIIIVDDELAVLNITASDVNNSAVIDNAELLFYNPVTGITQFYTTPQVITNLAAGEYELEVHPGGDYSPGHQLVDLAANDTMDIELLVGIPQGNASTEAVFTINSNIADAQIIVNNKAYSTSLTPSNIFIRPVNDTFAYTFTVFKEGYKTLVNPNNVVIPAAGGTYTLNFDLEAGTSGSSVGDLCSDILLPTTSGIDYSVGQFRGNVLLVNFWFYHCTGCREEFPGIQNVYEERYADGFRILGINTGWSSETDAQIDEFPELFGLTFPLLKNTIGNTLTEDLFDLGGTAPVNIIVDKEGIIRYRKLAVTESELNGYIDEILNED